MNELLLIEKELEQKIVDINRTVAIERFVGMIELGLGFYIPNFGFVLGAMVMFFFSEVLMQKLKRDSEIRLQAVIHRIKWVEKFRGWEKIEKRSRKGAEMRYRKIIYVTCRECGRMDEDKVEFINIEEDIQGKDVLTFRCPECKEVRKSYRLGWKEENYDETTWRESVLSGLWGGGKVNLHPLQTL
jgi:hypothetical protein